MLIEIKNITEQQLTLFDTIAPGLLRVGDSIAIRPTPTTDENYRLDNGRTYVFGVQVLVRHANWAVAWKAIEDIHSLWHNNTLAIDGLSHIQATTNPNFVGQSENKEYEFTAIYDFNFER